ncbi:pseudouridine synthase [Cetobacterium ceti]
MRINKYLSSIGVASRREVDRLIDEKKIKVNGVLANAGMKVSEKDTIEVAGKKIEKKETKLVYYMLNKPKRVISAAKDDRGRETVVDLIKTDERIFPIGRLDLDTEGLIVLTNDGDLFNKVIHPKAEVYKEYIATVKGEIKSNAINKLASGVDLEDGITLPARVKLIKTSKNKSFLSIAIREGRNRQVRRMLKEVGHPVVDLKRVAVGRLTLGDLEVGQYRKLTKAELKYLQSI